jgi:hypothetical protein
MERDLMVNTVVDVATRANTQKEHRHLQCTSLRISIIALLVDE